MKKRSGIKIDRWIRPFFKQYRLTLVIALVLGVLTAVFASALMFTSGYLISKAAETLGNIMLIFTPVALVRIFGVGKPFLQYLERLISHDWVLHMTSKLRLKLYDILEQDAIFFKQRYRTGDILGLLVEDIGHLQNLYLRSIFPLVIGWLVYFIAIICLGLFSWWFALVMLLLLGVVVILVPLVSVLINGARQARRKALMSQLYRDLTDDVLGVSDWVFSGRATDYLEGHKEASRALRAVDGALDSFSHKRDILLRIVYGVILVALVLWAGSYFGGAYAGPGNWIAAFALGFFPLLDVLGPLPSAADETVKYQDSLDRLNALPLETSTSPADDAAPQEPLTLEVESLEFCYPAAARTTLQDVSFTIAPGKKVAILGRSGSGKSTLLSLLRGDLLPSKGKVSVGGRAPSILGDAISLYMGVIQQQTYLFNMTLADNLRLGKQEATNDELWEVIEKVGLKELVERLPEGLETLVDEAGKRFSGGERQRIALARVLLQDVPIVLLDEPTVGLDPLTEQALLKTFFETMADKTVIMVTHHLQGVSMMDKVLFIEEGKLTLNGCPAELEESSAYYCRLQDFDRGVG